MNYSSSDPNLTANWFLSGINQTASFNNNFTLHLETPWNFNVGDIEVTLAFNNGVVSCGTQNSYVINNCNYDPERAAQLSSSQALKKAVSIYPNPADEGTKKVQVSLQATGKYEVSVVDKLGQAVMQFPDVVGQTSLDVSKLEPGVYFLHVKGKDGKTVKQFVVK
jgi:Secretion system C-terminal sorting domain